MSKYITNKADIFKDFSMHSADTGSTLVQVALLTVKINYLTEHLKTHVSDHDARRSLLMMVAKRRKFLLYVRSKSADKYQDVITALKIRDVHK